MGRDDPPSFEKLQEIADYDGLLSHLGIHDVMGRARESRSRRDLIQAQKKIQELLTRYPAHALPRDEENWVSAGANSLLRDVVEKPFKPMTDRYNEKFSNEYQGNKAKDELLEHGLAIERYVRVRPLKRKLLQVTKKGRNYVKNQVHMDWKPIDGRGGIVHQFWQHHIRNTYEEKGWQSELEDRDADVSLANGTTEYAVEVAMKDRPREVKHVRKHLVEFDYILIAARNNDVRDGLRKRLSKQGLLNKRVTVRPLTDFVDAENLPVE